MPHAVRDEAREHPAAGDEDRNFERERVQREQDRTRGESREAAQPDGADDGMATRRGRFQHGGLFHRKPLEWHPNGALSTGIGRLSTASSTSGEALLSALRPAITRPRAGPKRSPPVGTRS